MLQWQVQLRQIGGDQKNVCCVATAEQKENRKNLFVLFSRTTVLESASLKIMYL
jgi:hypothetical protein